MGKDKKEWHPNFLKYMEMIVYHPNYSGLPIKKESNGELKWIAPAESDIGKRRKEWALKKAKDLGYDNEPGVYAKTMFAIHPTKEKPCQICGKTMSLLYIYPNSPLLKSIKKRFGIVYNECIDLGKIWDDLLAHHNSNDDVADFLLNKFKINSIDRKEKEIIIKELEISCRLGGKKLLGPGAMSNFPDRYDGFHSYNRCCRSKEDKGRSKENLKSYNKDRRCYEYWNDGNICAANNFMHSEFFQNISADHIGPISLGFVHDPRYLQPMKGAENSSKRDRLLKKDIEKIIKIENKSGVYPMSWYSARIWEYIKRNFANNPEKIETLYRNALKQNFANVMYIFNFIIKNCHSKGENLLISSFLSNKFSYFDFTYEFDNEGNIISSTIRNKTERASDEIERYCRIAIDSVKEYGSKKNRNLKNNLTDDEITNLRSICFSFNCTGNSCQAKEEIVGLINNIQERLIKNL